MSQTLQTSQSEDEASQGQPCQKKLCVVLAETVGEPLDATLIRTISSCEDDLGLSKSVSKPGSGSRTDKQYETFVRMLRYAPADATFDDLLATDLLVRLTEPWWKQLYVQLLNTYYTRLLDDSIIGGTTSTPREFLTLRSVPLRLMQALLGADCHRWVTTLSSGEFWSTSTALTLYPTLARYTKETRSLTPSKPFTLSFKHNNPIPNLDQLRQHC